jgi:hypothetical protein
MSDDLLLDVEPVEVENPLREVVYSTRWLPVQCNRCGATMPEPVCFQKECICCEGETWPIEWHEYVFFLKKYTPHFHSQIGRLGADLLAERDKLVKYIGLMRDKPWFDAEAAVNTANQNVREIVTDFEERLWEGSL